MSESLYAAVSVWPDAAGRWPWRVVADGVTIASGAESTNLTARLMASIAWEEAKNMVANQ